MYGGYYHSSTLYFNLLTNTITIFYLHQCLTIIYRLYVNISVPNSPDMLSMRRMFRNKNVINQNTKIILLSILYYFKEI